MSNLPISDRIGVSGMAVVSGVLSKFAEWKGLRTLCSSRMLRQKIKTTKDVDMELKKMPLIALCVAAVAAVWAQAVTATAQTQAATTATQTVPELYADTIFCNDTLLVTQAWRAAADGSPVADHLLCRRSPSRSDTARLLGAFDDILVDTATSRLGLVVGVDTVRISLNEALTRDIRAGAELAPMPTRTYYKTLYSPGSEAVYLDLMLTLPTGTDSGALHMARLFEVFGMNIANLFAEAQMPVYAYSGVPSDGIESAMPAEDAADAFGSIKRCFDRANSSPRASLHLEMAPVWRSDDGKLLTVMIFCEYYTGGAHPVNMRLYLTMDVASGKLLGIRDIFPDGIPADVRDLDDPSWSLPFGAERLEGKWYPRPVYTRSGIIVTYQPYQNGCYADGVRYIIVPRR